MSDAVQILVGDCREQMRTLPAAHFQTCVTSPPYWGLRDYGCEGQLGLEATPEQYIASMVEVFREVQRVLRDDATLWVNIGDCYVSSPNGNKTLESSGLTTRRDGTRKRDVFVRTGKDCCPKRGPAAIGQPKKRNQVQGLKTKDLVGIPWMLAFALRADGWYLRADNVWGKPNGMPESVEDRPGRAHEYVFLLSKSPKYFYDHKAVRTAPKASTITRLAQDVENQAGSVRANGGAKTNGTMKAVRAHHDSVASRKARANPNAKSTPTEDRNGIRPDKQRGHSRRHDGFNDRWDQMEREEQVENGANLRSIWWVPPAQFSEAHFAVMPERVAEICIRAGSRPGDIVLDPFLGSGTTLVVARSLGRNGIGCELNPAYADMARRRIGLAEKPQTYRDPRAIDSPLFSENGI